jgi:energy-coupling factor transporter ATP-binding protein EcfA2
MNGENAFPAENPFCTRRIKPGALDFLFPPDETLQTILDRVRANGGWGEIVGPHGSGKSTLLAALIPAIQASGRRTQLIELHDGERRLPVNLRRIAETGDSLVLLVDGYEQLSRLSRFWLKRHCRRCGWGLIVTSHRPVGFPRLFDAAVTPKLAVRVVETLLQPTGRTLSPSEIESRFARHEGNLRELLFELYDWFEHCR